jgi:hypothetical protein
MDAYVLPRMKYVTRFVVWLHRCAQERCRDVVYWLNAGGPEAK